MPSDPGFAFYTAGLRVLNLEVEALSRIASSMDRDAFDAACRLILQCDSHIVLTGMGKSGHVARKAAATMSSTGTPAFFMHPAEAMHGDLGVMTSHNVLIALSHSGTTEEILNLLPYMARHSVPIIAITGVGESALASQAGVKLLYELDQEACPLNLAPTASTITQMALCDALAGALMEARGFTDADFAIRHPLGALGRRLLMHVSDLMVSGEENPVLPETATLSEAIHAMMRLGAVSFIDEHGCLSGIFCDGDLRRAFQRGVTDPATPMRDVMIRNPRKISPDLKGTMAIDAMQEYRISVLPVVDAQNRPVGMVDLKTLNRAGLVG